MRLTHFPLLLLSLPSLTTALITTITSTSTSTATASASISLQASTSISPQYTSPILLRSSILNSTNTYRTQHNATALTWNTTLALAASTYAHRCNWTHSGMSYGENLAENYANVTDAVDGWGDERKEYDWGKPGFAEGTGHFTQLVWRGTREVGCGVTDCGEEGGKGSARGWFVVCEYWPPGNVEGEYAEEVERQVGSGGCVVEGGGEAAAWVKHICEVRSGVDGRKVELGMLLGLGVGMVVWVML